MALLEIFKKKPAEKPVKETKPVEGKPEEAKKEPVKVPKKEKRAFSEAYRILSSPHITEKATDLTKANQYVFRVSPRANKLEIKRAVESVYGIDVISVRVIRVPAKRRRLGKITGWKEGYKKAVVKIKEGQKIEIMPR